MSDQRNDYIDGRENYPQMTASYFINRPCCMTNNPLDLADTSSTPAWFCTVDFEIEPSSASPHNMMFPPSLRNGFGASTCFRDQAYMGCGRRPQWKPKAHHFSALTSCKPPTFIYHSSESVCELSSCSLRLVACGFVYLRGWNGRDSWSRAGQWIRGGQRTVAGTRSGSDRG